MFSRPRRLRHRRMRCLQQKIPPRSKRCHPDMHNRCPPLQAVVPRAVKNIRHAHRRRRPRKLNRRERAVIVHNVVCQQRLVEPAPPRIQRRSKIQIPRPQHSREQPAVRLIPEAVHRLLLRRLSRLRVIRQWSRGCWSLWSGWRSLLFRRICLLCCRTERKNQKRNQHTREPQPELGHRSRDGHEFGILHPIPVRSPAAHPRAFGSRTVGHGDSPGRNTQASRRMCR